MRVVPIGATRSHITTMFRRNSFALLLLAAAAPLQAQAWSYPAFQAPRLESREFNFGVADAGRAGTTFLAQWRELAATRSQFTLELGLVAPDGGESVFALGGAYAYQAYRATAEVPLDILFTAGVGLGLGDVNTLRVPAGISLGYRFDLANDLAITPYAHPRLSLDVCGDCGSNEVGLGVNFDVGANLDLTSAIALRAAAFFGGGDIFSRNGVGLSVAWRPPGMRR